VLTKSFSASKRFLVIGNFTSTVIEYIRLFPKLKEEPKLFSVTKAIHKTFI